ncbi:condensation domain-containing protein [Kitasatospora sp. NPDC004669]|uniref:condensation domain-containing protein n=1 Tax=Kitasatospora sp. NPDC004669 TaxID=3154555 RepID=UPI0033B243A0
MTRIPGHVAVAPETDVARPTPVTPQQLAMLMHGDEDPESAVYGIANLLRVDEEVGAEVIAEAWRTVITEFSALRSGFTLDAQESWAITTAHEATGIPLHLCHCPGDDIDAHVEARTRDAAAEAAGRDRQVRVEVHLADRLYVIFAYHHALLDGWSAATVIGRALAHMRHLAGLGDAPAPVSDAMPAAQRSLLAAAGSADANDFWHQAVRRMPPSLLGQRADGLADHRELVEEIDRDVWEALVAVARRLGVTLPMLVTSAYASALSKALGQSGVTFGLVTSLRGIVEGVDEEAIGLFLNTLPYGVEPGAAEDWAQLARTMRRKTAEASQYSAVDIASLSSVTHPVSQLMDTALAFQTYPGAKGRFSDRSASDGRQGIVTVRVQDHTHYALTACVYPAADGRWAVRVSYDAARVAPTVVADLIEDLLLGLRDIVEDPARPTGCVAPADAAVVDPQARPDTGSGSEDVPLTVDSPAALAVAAVWKDLLGKEFDPAEDFFLSGGSSTSAMRLAMRLQSGLGVRVPVRAIFERRTGLEIVRYLEKVTSEAGHE